MKKMHVEEGIKHIGDVGLYYRIQGKGEPIVVLHGGPGMNHTYFFPHFETLAKTYKLICYDQRACGKSSGDIHSLTVTTFVNDLEGIRKAFNLDTMNLMGHSWGGLLALYYGVLYPEKVNSLILVDTALVTADVLMNQQQNRETRLTHHDQTALKNIFQSTEFAHRIPEAMEAFFRIYEGVNFYNRQFVNQFFLQYEVEAAKKVLLVNEAMQKDILNHDIHTELSRIDCLTLIIHGDYDTVPVKAAYTIRDLINGSRCIILRDCGHYPFIESPTEFFKIVHAFLQDVIQ